MTDDNHQGTLADINKELVVTQPWDLVIPGPGSLAIADTKKALGPIAVGLVSLLERRQVIEAEMQDLEKAGLCEATLQAEWRKAEKGEPRGPYYRLVYPTDERGHRRRVYAGNKPERVTAAKVAIGRYRRHGELRRELHRLDRDIDFIRLKLGQVRELLGLRDLVTERA